MALLHDPAVRMVLRTRLQNLRPDAARRWGSMTIDQMLWHVNSALEIALGRKPAARMRSPVPLPLLRWLALNAPWPTGVATMPEAVARGSHDFSAERERCLGLIDDLAARDLAGPPMIHPRLGSMTVHQLSRLQAKHVDYHLRQFGA